MELNKQVNEFLDQKKHPQRELIDALRRLILSCDKQLIEDVKWNAPNYVYKQTDRITLNLSGKGMVRVILHCGATKTKIPSMPLIDDAYGLLAWPANNRAVAQFKGLEDLQSQEAAFKKIIQLWLKAKY
jgi:hypothetical protein